MSGHFIGRKPKSRAGIDVIAVLEMGDHGGAGCIARGLRQDAVRRGDGLDLRFRQAAEERLGGHTTEMTIGIDRGAGDAGDETTIAAVIRPQPKRDLQGVTSRLAERVKISGQGAVFGDATGEDNPAVKA